MIVLVLVILVVAALVVATALVVMAQAVLRPGRMTDGKALYLLKRLSPADLGMGFEAVRFSVRDQGSGGTIELAGWWIGRPSGSSKTVVLIHGNSDAKVGAIAWAPTWQRLGYHILAIDLRAHGESGGKYTTAGVLERHDVDQVINQLRARRAQQTNKLVLFGASMGAVVALATGAMREDVDALVLDSPYADFSHAVAAHARLLEMPLQSLLPLALRLGGWMAGADFGELSVPEMLRSVRGDVMVIEAEEDDFVPAEDARAIEGALKSRAGELGRSCFWMVRGAGHLQALPGDPEEYARRIGEFLGE